MSVEVTMPQLGETVAEGLVTRWLHRVGDFVQAGEPLVEIATDKVDTEIPSPAEGTLLEILVPENVSVGIGVVLAVIGAALGPARQVGPQQPRSPRHAHSPRVRHLAAQENVSLNGMVGTGPSGRVTTHDVRRASAARVVPATASSPASIQPLPAIGTAPTANRDRREPMSRLRGVIAARMMSSPHESAQLTTVVETDVTKAVRLRADILRRQGIRLTITAFFARAVVEALRAHPILNASLEDNGRTDDALFTAESADMTVVHHGDVHLGVAVDTAAGLLVPVVRNAGELSLIGLARRISELAEGARAGRLGADQVTGATFTLANIGSRGVLFDTPILYPGQVGILGIGAVVERPVVRRRPDGEAVLAIRSMAHLALAYDHRLVNGADAADFLTTVANRLAAMGGEPDLG